MILSKSDLDEYLKADNHWLLPNSLWAHLTERLSASPLYSLRRYLRYLRKQEYYTNTAKGNIFKRFLRFYYRSRKNRLGAKLGIDISPNCFGKGLNLYHFGSIIINPHVRAGENCSLHGSNCIGNNGFTEAVPVLGNGVDVGYGAVIIGDVTIADGVIIGANAVVNRSITEPGCTVAGVPARIIKHGSNVKESSL